MAVFHMGLLKRNLVDLLASTLFIPAYPFLLVAARRRGQLKWSRGLQDAAGVTVVRNHYYEPVTTDADYFKETTETRDLPGIDWNLEGQLQTLGRFTYADQVMSLEGRSINGKPFYFKNSMFAAGDAEALYSFIRAFKPSTIIEIGSGYSTLVVRMALEDNQLDDPAYMLRHICFEPFENSWLEKTGAEIRRERIERADLSLFETLQPNDIVFIDSTHVLRTQGDVECEYLRILPRIPPQVLVHIHDIFTPRDYPKQWLKTERRFWTEQYFLEAFLSCNREFEILLNLNDLHRSNIPELREAFPMLAMSPEANPGSFWMRRKDIDAANRPIPDGVSQFSR